MTTTEPDTQQLCNRIRYELTDPHDDGRCVRKCDTCDGSGVTLHNRSDTPDMSCRDCNGTGRIEHRDRIAVAVLEFRTEDGLRFVGTGWSESHKPSIALEHWDNREGQPWQESLEAFVLGCGACGGEGVTESGVCVVCNGAMTGYVEDAPDYSTADGMVALKKLLREAGFNVMLITYYSTGRTDATVRRDVTGQHGCADTEPEALFAAAVKAVETA